jgi:hypothetical protein
LSLALIAVEISLIVRRICSNNCSLVPEGIVVVGATAVVVGAVSIMVVAHPGSNTAIANIERTKGFFMA